MIKSKFKIDTGLIIALILRIYYNPVYSVSQKLQRKISVKKEAVTPKQSVTASTHPLIMQFSGAVRYGHAEQYDQVARYGRRRPFLRSRLRNGHVSFE